MLIAGKGKKTAVSTLSREDNTLLLDTENGKIQITVYSDSIIRLRYTLSEHFSETQSPGTVPWSESCRWSYTEDATVITLLTGKIVLSIDKATARFSYYDSTGRLLAREPAGGGKTLVQFDSYKYLMDENSAVEKIVTPDGVKEVIRDARKVFDKKLYHTRLEFEWAEDEALYGLGQHEEGSLNLRGTRQYLHQANMKIAVPMLLSTRGYGILLDTYSPLIFNDNEYGSYLYNEAADELDYYFISGESFDDIVGGYRKLTGKAAMLPKWAFGYMQSQERYETQQEIIDTAMEYRRRKVPLDSIVLDWQSWEDGMWGQKSFDHKRFPDPEAMMRTLHENGVHFMISIWPNMYRESANYAEMKEKGCLFQQSEIYNAFDEKARSLYWKQAYEGLFSKGIDAWWCDSSEPVTPEWNSPFKPEPDQNYMNFHNTAKTWMDEACTNAYALFHARAVYEGQRAQTSEKRVVNLTRSGYTGQQKYGVILWSGDISAKWSTLEKQIPAGLNLCAAGLPFWTLDIGAFFVKKGDMWFWNGDFDEGSEDQGYRELYTRWLQFGSFLPVFRSHGTDTRREIWNFGEKGGMFYDAIAGAIELRYRLMPYIYSLAAMVTLKDYTMLRLLAFDFGEDKKVYDIRDQYMFGNALMVCPVTKPMYFGKGSVPLENVDRTREVYLPSGTDWYDFRTGERYPGGEVIKAPAPLDSIPLFVKAGAVIPMAEVAQHSAASSESSLTLLVCPGADGEFTLYQDEQDNYNCENGAYSVIDITWSDKEGVLTIGERKGHFNGMPESIDFTLQVMGREQVSLKYTGEEMEYRI
ncbi:MAG TPA: glycoside hydrolase family 31 protein [Clostridia bacterium]|nr:glycoside hydrolase family 31 protein [Clostridia bacterium]